MKMFSIKSSKKLKKQALVAEGGGFRNVFSAGVLDAFIAADFDPFDAYIGVSGGAMVLSSYVSKQYKRSYKTIAEIAAHPDFLSARRYISGGDYMGLDLLADIENEVYPFDSEAALDNIAKKDFVIVCTDVDSGQPCYVRPTRENWEDYLKASGALPILIRTPIKIQEKRLLDGALSSPLPVARAVGLGAQRIVVIRTRPRGQRESYIESNIESIIGSYLYRDFPMLQKIMKGHAEIYNAAIELMQEAPKGIEIVQIAADEPLQSSMTQYTPRSLQNDYRLGLELGSDLVHKFNSEERD